MAEGGRIIPGLAVLTQGRARLMLAVALTVLFGVVAATAGEAKAAEPAMTEFSMTPSTTQAGGHPDLAIKAGWVIDQGECPEPCLWLSHFDTHSPPGLIADPHVAPRCTLIEFSSAHCPSDSQIGLVVTSAINGFLPLYNMETKPDQAGLAGFTTPVLETPLFIEFFARTNSDYGLDSTSTPIIRCCDIDGVEIRFWGVPADPSHDFQRFITPLSFIGACLDIKNGCPGTTFASPTTPKAPLLSNPTSCGMPLSASVDGHYYGGAEVHAEAQYPTTTGCSQLSFSPSITAKPTTARADSPSGLDVNLKVPQTLSPDTPSPSELRAASITLPEGFSFNAGAADGKVACLESETNIGTLFAAACPGFSKVGTLELDVSALPGPIPGALYIAEPKIGNRYRVVLAADGFGTHVKLLGSAVTDPQTGRVTIAFNDLPQAPLQEFDLHVFGSERGLFATPERCGTYSVEAEFIPWDSELTTRRTTSFMTFNGGANGTSCPVESRPFEPSLQAGVLNNTAGRYSPFSLRVNRDDGDQNLGGVTVKTPPGFAATLKGIPYCPESAISQLQSASYAGLSELAAPACPAATQIGTTTGGGGAGSHPVYLGGKVYLAGPYKGAPLSLVAVIPAVSGPYDLGNLAVRAAIYVDPITAQVTAVSDPLPQIIEGIPLRTRLFQVDFDRPGFTFNPTNCDPFSVDTSLAGDEGATALRSAHFQVSNCANLPYEPRLALRLSGGLKRRGHPAIEAVFRASPGEANTRGVSVTLPKGELLDNAHIQTICTRVEFGNSNCPAGSRIGSVEATTPVLDQPLTGSVYLRSSSHRLPDLVLDLKGQVDIEAVAKVDSVRGRLRALFENVPDVPISTIVVRLAGGSKGLLQNSESLCGRRKKASVRMTGQNGATVVGKTKLKVRCGSKARHKRHSRAPQAVR
jgi:hypothetical protein